MNIVLYNGRHLRDILRRSSPDKTDSQLSDRGLFFVFLRTIIPEKRM